MPDKDIMVQIRAAEEQLAWSALDALTLATGGPEGGPDAATPLRAALPVIAEGWRDLAKKYELAKGKGFKTTYVDPLRHAAAELDKLIKRLDQPRRAPAGQLQPPDGAAPVDYAAVNAGLDEPVHKFEVGPGGTGHVCTAMVERNGAGDQCGRFVSHPAHRMQTPAIGDGAGLDELIKSRLIADAPDAETTFTAFFDAAAPEVAAVHAGNPIAKIAEELTGRTDPEWLASADEVAAYVRGEAEDIPGTPPLTPGSVRDQTVTDTMPDGDQGMAATERAGVPVTRFTYPDPAEPELLSDPARNSARTILETMPVSATIPPVPLLGQPGNAGAGYDHAYVPPGGVPATFTELLTPVPPAALPVHISHSQIETAGECPVKYRLTRIDHAATTACGKLPEIPQWAFIGGSAFHAWVEAYERGVAAGAAMAGQPGHGAFTEADARFEWDTCFTAECQKIEATSPVPRGRWRASKQGAENETWWNANGPKMIERYLKARPAEPTATLPAAYVMTGPPEPAIELERVVEVDTQTPYGVIPYKVIIDRVTFRKNPDLSITLIIRDYKTGDMRNAKESQLGEYRNVLRLLGVPPHVKILGSFFDARKGVWTTEVDLDARYPDEWFRYYVATGHAARLALTQGPTPARPSSFCGGCPVRWACPAKAAGR